jgi:anthranilate phosphoribosyltransferase
MNFAHYLKEIGRGAEGARHLAFDDACALYGAMLDGGVPDLELGAILLALRVKGESADEIAGFMSALDARVAELRPPFGRPRPVVLPSYNGSRRMPNLTPLLALLLQRHGIPVLVHGLIEGYGRVTSAQVFRALDIMPCLSLTQAQSALETHGLAFVPLQVLSGGLADLLALRGRMGVRNSGHSLAKMLDPFKGEAVLQAAATHPAFIDLMRESLSARQARALLMRATEGEPFANPKRRPRIEHLHEGAADILFEAEHDSVKALPNLPEEADAAATAAWIRKVLDGQMPLPQPIANQLAACLYACGYAQDFNQAKAIVAVESSVHAAVVNG